MRGVNEGATYRLVPDCRTSKSGWRCVVRGYQGAVVRHRLCHTDIGQDTMQQDTLKLADSFTTGFFTIHYLYSTSLRKISSNCKYRMSRFGNTFTSLNPWTTTVDHNRNWSCTKPYNKMFCKLNISRARHHLLKSEGKDFVVCNKMTPKQRRLLPGGTVVTTQKNVDALFRPTLLEQLCMWLYACYCILFVVYISCHKSSHVADDILFKNRTVTHMCATTDEFTATRVSDRSQK